MLVLEEAIRSRPDNLRNRLERIGFARRSGMMNEFCVPIAVINRGGRFNVILTVLSSATPQESTDFAA
jgi:hypothetical protein